MLGLIEKDIRLTLARKQTLLIFLVLALVMGLSMDGSFVIGYLTMLATIVAVGTISYDEFDNGFAFLMTLPFDRKTYVKEKYLFSFLSAAGAWCFGVVLYCLGSAIRHQTVMFADELPILLALLPVLFLLATVMIPLQLKYGSEKSRIVLFIIFGIIAVLIYGINKIFDGSDIMSGAVKTLDGISPIVVLVSIVAVCLLFTCASYLCSVRIMDKKEI
ncbi:MAG: ABC-2 transporter permease [Lachnospiraceae bacterium]|nr:ABC-2 transporter permease [Lachnospiraceae bacterium]